MDGPLSVYCYLHTMDLCFGRYAAKFEKGMGRPFTMEASASNVADAQGDGAGGGGGAGWQLCQPGRGAPALRPLLCPLAAGSVSGGAPPGGPSCGMEGCRAPCTRPSGQASTSSCWLQPPALALALALAPPPPAVPTQLTPLAAAAPHLPCPPPGEKQNQNKQDADHMMFHAPYNKLVQKAHARLVYLDMCRRGAAPEGLALSLSGLAPLDDGTHPRPATQMPRELEKALVAAAFPVYDRKVGRGGGGVLFRGCVGYDAPLISNAQ